MEKVEVDSATIADIVKETIALISGIISINWWSVSIGVLALSIASIFLLRFLKKRRIRIAFKTSQEHRVDAQKDLEDIYEKASKDWENAADRNDKLREELKDEKEKLH